MIEDVIVTRRSGHEKIFQLHFSNAIQLKKKLLPKDKVIKLQA